VNTYRSGNGVPIDFADPFGLRPLTDDERKSLGDMCDKIDCDKAQVHTGSDDSTTNARRDLLLKHCGGCRAVTTGNDIYIRGDELDPATDGIRDMSLLAHEMTHVGQFQTWGRIRYVAQGLMTQAFDQLGADQLRPSPAAHAQIQRIRNGTASDYRRALLRRQRTILCGLTIFLRRTLR
jgi:hypothetical protein